MAHRSIDALKRITAKVHEAEDTNTRNAGVDYDARCFIREYGTEILRLAENFTILREAMGYVENGTDTVVTIFQDDATKSWIIKAGKRDYWGDSLTDVFEKVKADQAQT